jgi:DNA-binding IclR family transcriptional regulator
MIDPASEQGRPYAALKGVGRAMEILEVVAKQPMRASDVAERLGLNWTTAHRSLTYLQEHRFLRRDGDSGIYRIGPRLYYLGQSYLHNHALLDAGSTALRALAHDTGHSAQLNEREGLEATVLLAVDAALEMIPKTTAEHRFPLHCGSKGQVMLAFSDPSVFDELVGASLTALTAQTITDPDVLAETLATIRREGYRVTRGDVQVGTGSVAAPIIQRSGEVAGAVCVITRAADLTEDATVDLIAQVTTMAREVSIRLGWRDGDTPKSFVHWEQHPLTTAVTTTSERTP